MDEDCDVMTLEIFFALLVVPYMKNPLVIWGFPSQLANYDA